MKNCTEYQDLCSAYLDGELTAAEQAELCAHLAACAECAAYLEQLRALQRLLAVDARCAPSSLHEEIMGAVEAQAQANARPAARPRRMPVFTMIAAAAAVVMMVTSGSVGNLFRSNVHAPQEENPPAAFARSAGADAARANGDAPQPAAFSAPVPQEPLPPTEPPAPENPTPENTTQETPPTPKVGAKTPISGRPAPAPSNAPAAPKPQTAAPQTATAPVAPKPANAPAPQTAGDNRAVLHATTSAGETIVLPETPQALREQTYAFCYVAVGSGTLPEFGGTLAAENAEGTAYYFTVDSNMNSTEKMLGILRDAKYEAAQRTDVTNVTLDSKAECGLIIVLRQ